MRSLRSVLEEPSTRHLVYRAWARVCGFLSASFCFFSISVFASILRPCSVPQVVANHGKDEKDNQSVCILLNFLIKVSNQYPLIVSDKEKQAHEQEGTGQVDNQERAEIVMQHSSLSVPCFEDQTK